MARRKIIQSNELKISPQAETYRIQTDSVFLLAEAALGFFILGTYQ